MEIVQVYLDFPLTGRNVLYLSQGRVLTFNPEEQNYTFLRNVCQFVPQYAMLLCQKIMGLTFCYSLLILGRFM